MTDRLLATLCLLGILIFILALLLNNPLVAWLSAIVAAAILGYIVGYGHWR